MGARGRKRRQGVHDDEERGLAPRRGLSPPVIFAIAASAVVVIGGLVLLFSGGGDSPQPTPAPPVTSQNPPAPAPAEPGREALVARQRRLLEEFEDRLRGEPDSLRELEVLVGAEIASGRLTEEVREEFQALRRQIGRDLEKAAQSEFDRAVARSRELQEKGQYQLALQIWRQTPAVVYASPLYKDWGDKEREAAGYATKGRYWSMIVDQVSSYVKKGNQDIARAILEENVTEKEFGDFALIWDDRQKLLGEIQRAESERIQTIIDLEAKQREERLAVRRAQREKEREEKWKYALEALDWEPLLSVGGDLENWQQPPKNLDQMGDPDASHYAWENIDDDDGEPVLQADSSDWNGPIWIGMNGNRWMDWALQFEVQVPEGKLTLETRAMFPSGGMGMPSEPVEKAEGIVLGSDAYGTGKWIKVFVFVRGREIRWLEGEDESSAALKKVIPVEHEKGGFRFLLDEASSCRIRRVQLKLVHALKRGEDDAESEYADDEEEDDDL